MPLTSLKQINQDTWLRAGGGPSRFGVCYYTCNFIESAQGIWNNPGSFANALEAARNFAKGAAMINYAKAQSLRKAPQVPVYAGAAGVALANNRIYRAALWVGPVGTPPGVANHEIMIVTGAANDVIYFEPNFGFFQASNPGMNNAQAVEHYINQQYGPGNHTGSFSYFNVRSNASAAPLSYTP